MEYPIHSVVMHITTGVCRIQDIQEKQFTEDQLQKFYVLQPIFVKLTEKMNRRLFEKIVAIMGILFAADVLVLIIK